MSALPDGVGTERSKSRTAVCCSGGGIRSASFSLGALQALADHRVLEDVDYLVAVSGGSYISASHALVAANSPMQLARDDVYAPGSPEEDHLRDNSRYLLPDAKVGLRGGLRLLLGLVFNLVLLLAWLFILGHALGWLLERYGLLTGLTTGNPEAHVKWAWVIPAALAIAALTFALSRGAKAQAASWWAVVLGAVAAATLLGAPLAIAELYDIGLHNDGDLGTVVRGLGFATPQGCAQARIAESDKQDAICGVTTGRREQNSQAAEDAYDQAPDNPRGQSGGFIAVVLALAGLVRVALGRLRGQHPTAESAAPVSGSTDSASAPRASLLSRALSVVQRILLPWLGTIIVLAILMLVSLRWTADGAIAGFTASELAKVAIVTAILGIGRVLVDVNRTSMHGFYRDRLAAAYAVVRATNESVVPRPEARISDLPRASERRGPELVVCAAANVRGNQVPPGRGAISFTFTPEKLGLSAAAPDGTKPELAAVFGRQDVRADSETYEKVVGVDSLTLFGGVAMSGAAISPLMGKMTRPAQRFLFAVANVRLGIWLPHPSYVDLVARPPSSWGMVPLPDRLRCWVLRNRLEQKGSWLRRRFHDLTWRAMQPNLRLLLAEAFGKNKVSAWWLYVSDGGHYENLGLVEALRRGATEVYVIDASGDKVTTWSTLGQAIALARSEVGVEVEITPEEMVEDDKVIRPWVSGTFTYRWSDARRPRTGTIHVCKLGVWPGAPWDVQAYAVRHPTFPTDSTLQQLYDHEEFEAYRALGSAAMSDLLDAKRQQHTDDLAARTSTGPTPQRAAGPASPR